jgi:hypothetical protein
MVKELVFITDLAHIQAAWLHRQPTNFLDRLPYAIEVRPVVQAEARRVVSQSGWTTHSRPAK